MVLHYYAGRWAHTMLTFSSLIQVARTRYVLMVESLSRMRTAARTVAWPGRRHD